MMFARWPAIHVATLANLFAVVGGCLDGMAGMAKAL